MARTGSHLLSALSAAALVTAVTPSVTGLAAPHSKATAPWSAVAPAPVLITSLDLPATARPGQRLNFQITVSVRGGTATNTTVTLTSSVPSELLGNGCAPRRCVLGDTASRVVIPGTLIAPAGETSLWVTAIADAANTSPVTIGQSIPGSAAPAPGTTSTQKPPSPSNTPAPKNTTSPTQPSISALQPPHPAPAEQKPSPLLPQVVPQTTPLAPPQQPHPDSTRLLAGRTTAPHGFAPLASIQAGWLLALIAMYAATTRRLRRMRTSRIFMRGQPPSPRPTVRHTLRRRPGLLDPLRGRWPQ